MNDRFENWATEVTGRPKAAWSTPGQMTPELIRQIFHGLTPGLRCMTFRLSARSCPTDVGLEVWSARQLAPFGYLVAGHAGGRVLQSI